MNRRVIIDDLDAKSKDVEAIALQIENDNASTAEEWDAIRQLRDASRYLFSAARWLERDLIARKGT